MHGGYKFHIEEYVIIYFTVVLTMFTMIKLNPLRGMDGLLLISMLGVHVYYFSSFVKFSLFTAEGLGFMKFFYFLL